MYVPLLCTALCCDGNKVVALFERTKKQMPSLFYFYAEARSRFEKPVAIVVL